MRSVKKSFIKHKAHNDQYEWSDEVILSNRCSVVVLVFCSVGSFVSFWRLRQIFHISAKAEFGALTTKEIFAEGAKNVQYADIRLKSLILFEQNFLCASRWFSVTFLLKKSNQKFTALQKSRDFAR
jgi:hypothetical protein